MTTSAPTLLSSAFSSAASGQNTTGLLLTTLAPILLSSLEPSTSTANATPTSSSPEDGGRDFNVTEPPMSGNTTEEFKVNYYVSPPISDWVFIAACTFLVCIGSFGIISNATIIFLFIKSSLIRTPFNYLLMNMIASELVIAMYGIPVDFMASYNRGWKMGKHLCQATGFILTTSGTVSIVTLSVISVQRYVSLSRPKRYRLISYKVSIMIIVFIWAYTMLVAIPPWFGWGDFVPETSGMTCAPDWESYRHFWYTVWWFTVGFLLPLVIIIASSIGTVSSITQKSIATNNKSIRRRSRRREMKIGILVFWMNVAFLVCWMPYGVITVLYFIGGEGFVHPAVVVIPLMAAKTSVCWNPILYVAMNPQFRGAFNRYFKTTAGRHHTVEEIWMGILMKKTTEGTGRRATQWLRRLFCCCCTQRRRLDISTIELKSDGGEQEEKYEGGGGGGGSGGSRLIPRGPIQADKNTRQDSEATIRQHSDPIPLTSTTTTQNLARLDKMVKFEVEGVKEKRKEKQPSLIRSYSV